MRYMDAVLSFLKMEDAKPYGNDFREVTWG